MIDADDYAYRFQYADGSAFVIYANGEAFITFPEVNGRTRPPEKKSGIIDNRIPLLIGRVAKPRQDRIDALMKALELIEYASRKDSLTDHERLQSVRTTVCAELSRLGSRVGRGQEP